MALALPIAWNVNRVRGQLRAVDTIRRAGGQVYYDYEYSGGVWTPGKKPRAPGWLRERLGDDYFRDVTYVGLGGADSYWSRGHDLGLLRAFPRLEGLVTPYGLTDDKFAPIADLHRLRELSLYNSKITNAGLAHLDDLSELRVLHLDGGLDNALTDDGLIHLRGLTNLEQLMLGSGKVTDAGMPHIARLKKLEILNLWGTGIGDAGLARLRGLRNLRELTLNGTRITDAGIETLRGMKSLRVLGLAGTRVTDAGLTGLRDLDKLRELSIWDAPVSAAGMADLRKALPGLLIKH